MMIADQGENPTERQWQLQSEQIHRSLVRSGLDDSSITGAAGMESFLFTIRDHMNQGVSRLKTAVHDIVQSLDLDGIRASIRNGEIRLLIPQLENVAVPMLDLLARHEQVPKSAGVLGLSEDGSTIFHDFSSKDTPHLLVVGGRDAGKTVMLRSIAASLAIHNRQSEIQIAAISPVYADAERQRGQAASWLPLNYLPHMVCDVAVKHSDIIDLLTYLNQEVAYRENHSFAVPRLVVFIDEADLVLLRGGRECAEPILRLAQKGEDVGIHLVLSTQAIDSATFGIQLIKEMSTRLIGRPETAEHDRGLPGLSDDNDVEQLLGEGDFLHRQGSQIRRLQGAYIDDYDLHLKLTELYRSQAILLAQPAVSRLRLDEPVPEKSTAVPWQTKKNDQMVTVVG